MKTKTNKRSYIIVAMRLVTIIFFALLALQLSGVYKVPSHYLWSIGLLDLALVWIEILVVGVFGVAFLKRRKTKSLWDTYVDAELKIAPPVIRQVLQKEFRLYRKIYLKLTRRSKQ